MTLTLSKKEIMNEARSAMTINIGKAGVNDNVIEEIKRQLKSNPIIKLRFAKNVARNKDDLISKLWGFDSDVEYNNIEVYISFLRKKLAYVESDVKITTIRRVGYRLE